MNGWQPIETAPEGVDVLVAVQWADAPAIAMHTHGRWLVNTEHVETHCGMWCQGGTPTSVSGFKPTHWQPLPGPPGTVLE